MMERPSADVCVNGHQAETPVELGVGTPGSLVGLGEQREERAAGGGMAAALRLRRESKSSAGKPLTPRADSGSSLLAPSARLRQPGTAPGRASTTPSSRQRSAKRSARASRAALASAERLRKASGHVEASGQGEPSTSTGRLHPGASPGGGGGVGRSSKGAQKDLVTPVLPHPASHPKPPRVSSGGAFPPSVPPHSGGGSGSLSKRGGGGGLQASSNPPSATTGVLAELTGNRGKAPAAYRSAQAIYDAKAKTRVDRDGDKAGAERSADKKEQSAPSAREGKALWGKLKALSNAQRALEGGEEARCNELQKVGGDGALRASRGGDGLLSALRGGRCSAGGFGRR
ncbi:hypothetical protein CYMTET_23434 [Cymbomonas tetramitiformis]|uniref:Uncharacterized protein n=1 Tax=Cymbomonas tetramitiformis TaxID=36881 RepID=A0AAE0FZC5_9CHLO|nr:hypothetical protein CYMTET_23434 [Cymbomonas tetramitiformis]